MTISILTKTSAVGSTNGNVTSSAINTTGASLLVITISYGVAPTISDSKGNTWVALTEVTNTAGGFFGRLYYAWNPIVGTNHTFTATAAAGGSWSAMCISSYSGVLTSSNPLDISGGGFTSSTSQTAGITSGAVTVTPNNDDSLIISGIGLGLGVTGYAAAGGFTLNEFRNHSPNINYGSGQQYLIQGTKAGISSGVAVASWTTAVNVSMVYAVFKAGVQVIPQNAKTKTGSFNLATVAGNQSITGLGFQPKAVIFYYTTLYANAVPVNIQSSMLGCMTGTSQQWCTVDYNKPGDNNYATSLFSSTSCIIETSEFLATEVAASFFSMDSDGFTINNTVVRPEVRTVYYWAIGGLDVSATAGVFTTATVTGNQSVTGLSFQPKAVIFGHGSMAASGVREVETTQPHSIATGIAISSSNRAIISQAANSAGTVAVTSGVLRTDRCLLRIDGSGVITEAADFVSQNSNGFTVNWLTKSGTAFLVGYLALGGNARYALGTFNQPTTSTGGVGSGQPAATIHVTTTGNDTTGNGSANLPYRTIAKACSMAVAGSVIEVGSGTWGGTGMWTGSYASGTSTNPIILRSKVKWGAKMVPSGGSLNAAIQLGANWWIYDGFEIDGSSGYSGNTWIAPDSAEWRNGIYITGSNIVVQNCHVHDVGKSSAATSSAGGSGINTDTYYGGNDNTIRYCWVHHIGSGVGNNHVQGIYVSSRAVIHGNLVHHIDSVGIHLWHGADQVKISNNTCFRCIQGSGIMVGSGDGGAIAGGVTQCRVFNNICRDSNFGISEFGTIGTGNLYSHNLVYNCTTPWSLIASTHTNSLSSNPQMVNFQSNGSGDYRLASGSPAINAGISSLSGSAAPTMDLDGKTRPQSGAYDLGAYEFGAVAQTSGPTAITGLGFSPVGEMILSSGKPANTVPTPSLTRVIGTADSALNMGVITTYEIDGSSEGLNPRSQKTTTKLVAYLDNLNATIAAATIQSQDGNGFTLNWTSTDTNARQSIYFALAGGLTTVNPFEIATKQTQGVNGNIVAPTTNLVVADRILEFSNSTGTGNIVLGGAITGFRPFSYVCRVDDNFYYTIEAVDANGVPIGSWEVGYGVYSAANTITRLNVLASSNDDFPVDFLPGRKEVWIDLTSYQIKGLLNNTNAPPSSGTGRIATLQTQKSTAAVNSLAVSVATTQGRNISSSNVTTTASTIMPVGFSSGYILTFEEHFNSSTLNTSKWNMRTSSAAGSVIDWESASTQASRPINYDINAGNNSALRIWPQVDPNASDTFFNRSIDAGPVGFLGGAVHKFQQTYGYFEARMILPKGKGVSVAWWLYDASNSTLRPELEICGAFGAADGVWSTTANPSIINNYATAYWIGDGTDNTVAFGGSPAGNPHKLSDTLGFTDLTAAYHTYGLRWAPNSIRTYFDGTLMYADDTINMLMSGSNGLFPIMTLFFGGAAGGASPSVTPQGNTNSLVVDYIRAWSIG